jgi:hypothetical protein
MERVNRLLKGNYWIIDLGKAELSKVEFDFLRYFFDIQFDIWFDERKEQPREFIILKKKPQFVIH